MASHKKSKSVKSLQELPEEIVHHIFSFLPTKKAAQISLLSKGCFQAWRSSPNLDFNYDYFTKMKNRNFHTEQFGKRRRKAFLRFTRRTMKRYRNGKISIRNFTLVICPIIRVRLTRVDRWIETAVQNGAENIFLDINPKRKSNNMDCYSLPSSIFGAKSLIDLVAIMCKLDYQEQPIKWPNLRRLNLKDVCINQDTFENIISSCELIEFLKIENCKVLKRVRLTSLKYLKELFIDADNQQIVQVEEVPRLESCVCKFNYSSYQLVNCVFNSFTYENIKHLQLFCCRIADEFFEGFDNKYPLLEKLEVILCQNLKRIKISSHTLESVTLVSNLGLKDVKIDVSRKIEFSFVYGGGEFPTFSFTIASIPSASKIVVNCSSSLSASWFLRLKQLLMNLMGSDVSLIIHRFEGVSFNIDEIRCPELAAPQIGHVYFYGRYRDYSTFLKGLLWSCHPNSLTLYCGLRSEKFINIIYEKLVNKNLQQIEGWQQDLKEVQVFIKKGTQVKAIMQDETLQWYDFSKLSEICFRLGW